MGSVLALVKDTSSLMDRNNHHLALPDQGAAVDGRLILMTPQIPDLKSRSLIRTPVIITATHFPSLPEFHVPEKDH